MNNSSDEKAMDEGPSQTTQPARSRKSAEPQRDEAQEVSKLVTGYKFALGVAEVLLALGIAIYGNKALRVYQDLKSSGFLEGPYYVLVNLIDKSIPFILEHKLAITIFLLIIGIVKIVSCIAIWMDKEWGVHLLLFLMLVLLPFDLFDMFRNFFTGHIGIASLTLNAINVWIILSLTHYHPIRYLRMLRA